MYMNLYIVHVYTPVLNFVSVVVFKHTLVQAKQLKPMSVQYAYTCTCICMHMYMHVHNNQS